MRYVLLPLASTSNAAGLLDAEMNERLWRVAQRYLQIRSSSSDSDSDSHANLQVVRVVTSGSCVTSSLDSFNPNDTPQHEITKRRLVQLGVDENDIKHALPAMHTVDEAIMAAETIANMDDRDEETVLEVVVSAFHRPRAAHLFGVAFEGAAGVTLRVTSDGLVPRWTGDVLAARLRHERRSLNALRTKPFGAWADFLQARGVLASHKPIVDGVGPDEVQDPASDGTTALVVLSARASADASIWQTRVAARWCRLRAMCGKPPPTLLLGAVDAYMNPDVTVGPDELTSGESFVDAIHSFIAQLGTDAVHVVVAPCSPDEPHLDACMHALKMHARVRSSALDTVTSAYDWGADLQEVVV